MSNSLKITQHMCKSRAGQGGWLWAVLLITPPGPLWFRRGSERWIPPEEHRNVSPENDLGFRFLSFLSASTGSAGTLPLPLWGCRQRCICQFYGYAASFPWQPLEDLKHGFFKSSLQVWPESCIMSYPFLCGVIP